MPFSINGRKIGTGFRPYFVAEMSGNHENKLDKALKIIDAAKEAGADAIKLQTYKASTMTIDHDGDEFFLKEGLWKNRKLYDLYEEASTPWDWHEKLFEHANNIGISIFSSPFDITAVDFLENLSTPIYKIASPEIIDLPLIKKICETGKPIILSTGAANLAEISDAVEIIRTYKINEIMLLHCTSAYPAPLNEANLSTMQMLKTKFNADIGLSDHTLGIVTACTAVGLGASLIEKHFTLSRDDDGIDNAFSLEPKEFKSMVSLSNDAFDAIGKPQTSSTKSELNVEKNRRSLYIVSNIKKGEIFTEKNIRSIRPANGISPKFYYDILGRKATRELHYGQALVWEMIENFNELKDNNNEIIKKNLEFIVVDSKNEEHCSSLFKLLCNRKFSISHKETPKFKDHVDFVKNNPYRVWFLIKNNNIFIGSIYVLNDNGIGLDLNESSYGLISDILLILFSKIKPLDKIPSLRNKKFHMNIHPSNKKLSNILKNFGGYITQKTFAFE